MFEELEININTIYYHHLDGDRRKKKVRVCSPVGNIKLQGCNPSSLEKLLDFLQEEVFTDDLVECTIKAKTYEGFY